MKGLKLFTFYFFIVVCNWANAQGSDANTAGSKKPALSAKKEVVADNAHQAPQPAVVSPHSPAMSSGANAKSGTKPVSSNPVVQGPTPTMSSRKGNSVQPQPNNASGHGTSQQGNSPPK